MTIDDKRLTEIVARAGAATEGPWEWNDPEKFRPGYGKFSEIAVYAAGNAFPWRMAEVAGPSEKMGTAIAQFIAHARTDIPDMAAEIRRLWAEREDAIAALNSDTIRIAELSAQVRPPRAQVVELKKQLAHYDDLYGQERDRRIAAEAREKRLREALRPVERFFLDLSADLYGDGYKRDEFIATLRGRLSKEMADLQNALAAEEPQT